jgi:hypothetical protein
MMTIALLIALIAVVIGCTLHLALTLREIAATHRDTRLNILGWLAAIAGEAKAAAEREQKRDEMRAALFTGEGRDALRQRLRERQEKAAKG